MTEFTKIVHYHCKSILKLRNIKSHYILYYMHIIAHLPSIFIHTHRAPWDEKIIKDSLSAPMGNTISSTSVSVFVHRTNHSPIVTELFVFAFSQT